MILVDTSVWVDHLRSSEPRLVKLLNRGEVLVHPFVIGELACGNLQNRQEILLYLYKMPKPPIASESETLTMIENYQLMGRGIGYIDAHLLASVLLGNGSRLWTRDKRLSAIVQELSLAYEETDLSSTNGFN